MEPSDLQLHYLTAPQSHQLHQAFFPSRHTIIAPTQLKEQFKRLKSISLSASAFTTQIPQYDNGIDFFHKQKLLWTSYKRQRPTRNYHPISISLFFLISIKPHWQAQILGSFCMKSQTNKRLGMLEELMAGILDLCMLHTKNTCSLSFWHSCILPSQTCFSGGDIHWYYTAASLPPVSPPTFEGDS